LGLDIDEGMEGQMSTVRMDLAEELMREPIPSEMPFPVSEYDERLGKVRQRMAERGLDVLLVTNPPNICYLSGYESLMSTGYATLILPIKGDLTLHLPELDIPSMLLNGWVRDLVVFDWAYPIEADEQLAEALAERGLTSGVIGIEMGQAETFAWGAMDARTYLRLKGLLPSARLEDATGLVQEVRVKKSAAELECMRRAGEWSWAGMQASLATLAPGRTDNDLAAAAYAAMIGAGSEVPSIAPIVLAGRRSGWAPHNMFKRYELGAGDSFYLEYSGNYCRYNAPMMRGACIGEPSQAVRRMAEASLATVEILLQSIRPGRSGHDIARDAEKGLEGAGEDVYFHRGYGYAVGLGFSPTWTEAAVYIAEGNERPLEPGMTFHLPIGIWIPGKCGVSFSETVIVTEEGCDLVTPGEGRELYVAKVAVTWNRKRD
jgi:Xaa-Pro dipeptidase